MATILCVDDEASFLLLLEEVLQGEGHRTVAVTNVAAALAVVERGGVDLVVSDYRMPDSTGLELLPELERRGLDTPLIMLTGYGSIEHAVAAIKAGAIDYVTKPFRPPQLVMAVDQALEFARLRRENAQLREEVTQMRSEREMIGESAALKRIVDTVRTVAATRATVLVQGESGTGKELLARTIHGLSDRHAGPFVAINCAALPENLVESTLFGHEKGAFTGALKQVRGAFERAHRGTLLLDEVSEMRLDLQAKLLRVLQEQEFERVGGSAPISVDVRVIATTNRDLVEHVRTGAFREDLYYRLSVVPIVAPPLRERKEDIPLLVRHFAQKAARDQGKAPLAVDPAMYALLAGYDWPGNVRELSHAVERAVIFTRGEVLEPSAFSGRPFGTGVPGLAVSAAPVPAAPAAAAAATPVAAAGAAVAAPASDEVLTLDGFDLNRAEERLIERALAATGNNRTRAAELLGISVRTLRNKLNQPTRRPDSDPHAVQLSALDDDPEGLAASD